MKHHERKTCGGVEVWIHAFLTSAVNGGGQLHTPAVLSAGKEPPVSHCVRGCVEPWQLSRYSPGLRPENRGSRVRFPEGAENFLFTTASRTALGPTQPPMQWVPVVLSLRVKWPVREDDHSPPSSAKVKEWVELYLHCPIRLHGVVLS
jgi:hypothetical protein